MSCTGCFQLIELIPSYNDSNMKEVVIHTDETRKVKPQDICIGPDGSILAVNGLAGSKSVCHYCWERENVNVAASQPNQPTMVLKKKIPIEIDFPPHIAYDKLSNLVIVSKWRGDPEIFAYNLETSSEIWKFGDKNSKEIEGVKIQPCGLAVDSIGRLYVGDGYNSRVLVIDSATGKFHQCLNLPHLGTIRDISWGNVMYPEQHMLTVMHTTQQGVLGVTHFAICPDDRKESMS